MEHRTADERLEAAMVQQSRERMLAKGWDLSEEAIRRAEDLISDGLPMDGVQAKQLAMFLDVATERVVGKHVST